MYYKRCFVYLCYDFPIIDILCFTRLFCISVFCFPYYCYFLYHNRCFVYLCSVFPMVGILCFTSVVLYIFVLLSLLLVFYVSQALFCISVLWIPYNWYFISHKRCFVYLCYDFPIICILCLTFFCFVYLCSVFPIIGILCLTSVVLYICVMISLELVFYVSQALFCISVLWFPHHWYFMFHKGCFVYLCSAFPIIGVLCITSVVLYIFVMISL
jgi:hypothetical protein